MTSITTSEIRTRLSETLSEVVYQSARVVISRSGKKIAALVPISDFELLERLEDEVDVAEAKRRLKASKGKTVPWKKVKETLGL